MSGKEDKALHDETGRASADPKHAAVSLPAGSYDIEALAKALDETVDVADDDRVAAQADAIRSAAAEDTVLDPVDGSLQPGYEVVELEHADLGVTERAQVYVGGDDDADAEKPPVQRKSTRRTDPVASDNESGAAGSGEKE